MVVEHARRLGREGPPPEEHRGESEVHDHKDENGDYRAHETPERGLPLPAVPHEQDGEKYQLGEKYGYYMVVGTDANEPVQSVRDGVVEPREKLEENGQMIAASSLHYETAGEREIMTDSGAL
jgi:hypothetical protein